MIYYRKGNRREFLKAGFFGFLGLVLGKDLLIHAEAACCEPMIYKRFLRFTEYEERKVTEVLVIHHTGIPGVDKDSTAADIHKYHQEVNGWAGIGYHYLIQKNGMIEQGRRPNAVGAHAYEHNKTSIGICLAGNFTLGKPTAAQMDSVKELCAWLCRKYGLDPTRKGVIVGHQDLNDDADCPGMHLYKRLPEIRQFCEDNR